MRIKKQASGYKLIFGYIGIFLVLIGIINLLPLFIIFTDLGQTSDLSGPYWKCFAIPGGASILLGLILYFLLIFKRERGQLEKYQDIVLLVFIWLVAIIISAVPFMLAGMSFTDAIFDSTSGYSTTGLTRYFVPEYESLSKIKIFLFHRASLQFFGGVGLILIVASAISDRHGLKLYMAEGHNDRLLPNLKKSASLIMFIYILYILAGTAGYIAFGMDWFDAMCHSISSVATGGFSTKSGGLIEAIGPNANVIGIEIVTCVLMILGSTNFLTHMYLLRGKFKRVFKDCEIRLFLILTVVLVPIFALGIFYGNPGMIEGNSIIPTKLSIGESFRYGAFTYISAITTTGFTNYSSALYLGELTIFLVILCSVVGGGMGSTAGAVKQYRIVITLKSMFWSIRESLSNKRYVYPHNVCRFGKVKRVSNEESLEALRYLILYLMVIAISTLLVMFVGMANGISFTSSLSEYVNAISSTGLTCGVTALNNPGIHWILIVGMLLGRLEITPFYFFFYRVIRDIGHVETY